MGSVEGAGTVVGNVVGAAALGTELATAVASVDGVAGAVVAKAAVLPHAVRTKSAHKARPSDQQCLGLARAAHHDIAGFTAHPWV